MKTFTILTSLLLLLFASSCRNEDYIIAEEEKPVQPVERTEVVGLYVLNEGNMGMNKSTLDYLDYSSGGYISNIYSARNPDVPKELGDVGNDLQIYGSRLYAVVNCSNKVEVMDAATCRRLGQVDIPNCRYIVFDEGYAYVSSYAGPVELSPEYQQRGFVAKVDTATMQVVGRCLVGFQPDGMAVSEGRLYVANSGGYMVPNYERTVSVIDLATFTATGTIDVDINLHYVVADRHRNLWIASRGDYYGAAPALYRYSLDSGQITKKIATTVSNYWLDGDSLYTVGSSYDFTTGEQQLSYLIVNTTTGDIASQQYVSDAVRQAVNVPYGVCVNPVTKDIYVSDGGDYVNPGTLFCLASDGTLKWKTRTGDIPAHFAFLTRQLTINN